MNDDAQSKLRNGGLRRRSVLGWLHMSRISNRVIQAMLLNLGAWELSRAQFDILAHVGSAGGILQIELAGHLFVTQGNITQVLDKMEERGLIRRVREGRTKRLYLTEAGQQLYEMAVPPHQEFIAAQFDALTPDEQHQLMRLLAKLDRAQRS